jgi:hypothetical protein
MVSTDWRHSMEVEGMEADDIQRQVLPIPDRLQVGLVTYDAKDPATKFPRSSRCGHRRGRPMC